MAHGDASEVALDERQLDALRELANIGCGHAASALSKLLGGSAIGIEVPRAELVDVAALCEHIGGRDTLVVGVATDVAGTLSGRLLVLMPDADARALAGLLLGTMPPSGPLSPEAQSAICEAGNIVGSACLCALARAFGLEVMPSVPRLFQDAAGALLQKLDPSRGQSKRALVLETRFLARQRHELGGHLLILPDLPTLPRLLGAMGL
jgi:chemotaxis protein CheC